MRTTALFVVLMLGAATGLRAERTNAAPTMPPPLPPPPIPRYQRVNAAVRLRELSPVAYFRVLLGMTPAQRERALAEKTPDDRQAILRKVSEYEALPAAIREARLRQTELRWMLVTLMKIEPAQRAERMRGLADPDRAGIEDRLRHWDLMPVVEQKAYLEKESFVTFYLRWEASSAAGHAEIIGKLPPAIRAEWSGELSRWQALPETARRQMCDRFSQFFTMDDRQQQATVNALSIEERRQMEISLRAFAQLPAKERGQCVQSFSRFATMTSDEQNEFLRNAAQWQEMTPQERRLWRDLVQRLPPMPPMPPGFRRASPGGLPPMPPGFNEPSMPNDAYAKSAVN